MIDINYYRELPDSMSSEEIKILIGTLLKNETKNVNEICVIVEALQELSERQWHTYEKLPKKELEYIEIWIHRHWQPTVFEFIDPIISIAGLLGLKNVFEELVKTLNDDIPDLIRHEINSAIDELEDNIEDPFSRL